MRGYTNLETVEEANPKQRPELCTSLEHKSHSALHPNSTRLSLSKFPGVGGPGLWPVYLVSHQEPGLPVFRLGNGGVQALVHGIGA